MFAIALQWRRARWLRFAPGSTGLFLLLSVPLLFLLPLQDVPLFSDWRGGATTIFWLGTVLVTALFSKDSGYVPRSDVWPYQKGIALVDWHTYNWLLDGAAALVVLLWWSALLAFGMQLHPGWNGQLFIGILIASGLLILITHSFLFAVGAAGIPRAIDIFVVAALLGVFRPLLLGRLPELIRTPLGAILPPIVDAYGASRLLLQGEPGAFKPLLAVFAYSFACCTIALFLLRRAKPPV